MRARSLLQAIRRNTSGVFCCPRNHVSLREKTPGSGLWKVCLTEYALDSILVGGDIDRVEVQGDQKIVCHWSGLRMSEGDELYHVIWQEHSGKHEIELPNKTMKVVESSSSVSGMKSTDDLTTTTATTSATDPLFLCLVASHPPGGPLDWPGLVSEDEYATEMK